MNIDYETCIMISLLIDKFVQGSCKSKVIDIKDIELFFFIFFKKEFVSGL